MTLHFRVALLCGAVLLPLAACSGRGPAATTEPASNPHADARFLNEAPVDLLQTVTFAKLAVTKAGDPAVRSFAAQVTADDSGMRQKLAAPLRDAGLSPPTDMDGQHQILYHRLETMNGHAFDRAYVDGQLQDQTMMIELFQAEADSGKLPALQQLAHASLPAMLQTLGTAQALSQDR